MFRISRVRIRWINTDQHDPTVVLTTQLAQEAPSSQVLGTFNLPKLRVRLMWVGLGAMNRISVWAWGLFILMLGIFAFTRLAPGNHVDPAFEAERVRLAGLITDEVSLNDETIRITHSSLDIGRSPDIFDHDIDTLIRGLEANPLRVDLPARLLYNASRFC